MKTDIGMRRLLPTFTANSKFQEGVKRKDGRDAVRADTAAWRVGWHYFKVSAHTALMKGEGGGGCFLSLFAV